MDISFKLLRGYGKINFDLLKEINQSINQILSSYVFEFNTPEVRAEITGKIMKLIRTKHQEIMDAGVQSKIFVKFFNEMIDKTNERIFDY
jgi:hypothetical protein